MKTRILCILGCVLSVILGWQMIAQAVPAGTGFTYNGRLEQNNNPPTAFFDFEFALFDDPNGIEGSQVSETLFFDHLRVHKGSFNVRLDFGEDAFDGNARWLLLSVREDNENDPNAFEDLLPLVQLTPAPYALSANKIAGKELADLIQKSEPNSVGGSMLKKGSITKEKLENGAVGKEKIENGAVGKEKLENGAVDPNKLATNAVAREKIQNGAINSAKLANKAVGQGQLNDKAVGRGQLGDKAVGKGQIDDAAVDPNKLEDGAVTTAKLGDISGYNLATSYAGFLMTLTNSGTTGPGDDGHVLNLESAGGMVLQATSNGPMTQDAYGVYAENTSDGTAIHGEGYAGYGISGHTTSGIAVRGELSGSGWAGMLYGRSAVMGGLFVTDTGSEADPEEALHIDGKVYLKSMASAVGGGYTVKYESNRLVIQTSSEKYKENIQPMEDDYSRILQAQPRSFVWKGSDNKDIGFIAEEFDALGLNNLVIYKDGKPDGVRYEMVPLYLLETAKDMAETTNQLKQENESLKQQIQSLKDAFEDLKSSIAREVE
ncbi:MAG: tail fiber domain-containing protein [Planctomycetota bacterium]|jgi:hypothetical protein